MDPDAARQIDEELACDFMWHASDNHFHILNQSSNSRSLPDTSQTQLKYFKLFYYVQYIVEAHFWKSGEI